MNKWTLALLIGLGVCMLGTGTWLGVCANSSPTPSWCPAETEYPPLKEGLTRAEKINKLYDDMAKSAERTMKVDECSQYYEYMACSLADDAKLDKWIAHAHNVTGK